MEPAKDSTTCYDQMAIVEKYERVIAYLYPIAQSMPRKHGTAREMFLQCLLGVPDLLFQAGKSNQVSRIYAADAALAHLRFWMRFLHSVRAMSPHQLQTAQVLLAEVGAMVGAWVKRKVARFIHHQDFDRLNRFVASWRGHTQWADAHNLNQWMENRYGITL